MIDMSLSELIGTVNPFWKIQCNDCGEKFDCWALLDATNTIIYCGTKIECIAFLQGYKRLQDEITEGLNNDN